MKTFRIGIAVVMILFGCAVFFLLLYVHTDLTWYQVVREYPWTVGIHVFNVALGLFMVLKERYEE